MEFKLANGTALTDDEIDRECEEYESGTWSGSLTNLRVGPQALQRGAQRQPLLQMPRDGGRSYRACRRGMRHGEVRVPPFRRHRKGREDFEVGLDHAALGGPVVVRVVHDIPRILPVADLAERAVRHLDRPRLARTTFPHRPGPRLVTSHLSEGEDPAVVPLDAPRRVLAVRTAFDKRRHEANRLLRQIRTSPSCCEHLFYTIGHRWTQKGNCHD